MSKNRKYLTIVAVLAFLTFWGYNYYSTINSEAYKVVLGFVESDSTVLEAVGDNPRIHWAGIDTKETYYEDIQEAFAEYSVIIKGDLKRARLYVDLEKDSSMVWNISNYRIGVE